MSSAALHLLPYKMEHIFSLQATLAAPEVIGPVAEGIRANFYPEGGTIAGPRFQGRIRAGGGDWILIRRDGVAILDVRLTAESHDGALVEIFYTGVSDAGPDGYERFLNQQLPPIIPIHAMPRFRTAHPTYEWLNRIQAVGIGEVRFQKNEVHYDIYALR